MKLFLKVLLGFLSLVLLSGLASAQPEPSQKELENVLRRFINWRFGTMSLYRVTNIADIKRAIKSSEEKKAGIKMDESLFNSVDSNVRSVIERGVKGGMSSDEVRNEIINQGLLMPDVKVFESIFTFYKKQQEGGGEQSVENAYIVTTRPEKGMIPNTIIALIVSYNPTDNLEKNLKSVGPSEIFTYDELKAFKLDSTFNSENLYDLMVNVMVQQNYTNRSLDAQGIGNPEWFATKVHGKTYSMVSKEGDVSSEDIQKFMRISDATPDDITLKQNEVIVSPDLISWKMYHIPSYPDASGNMVADTLTPVNAGLPAFGLELRYGIDNINYPSFFSDRMAVNALWESVKMGIILPTDGWASLSKDMFNIDRKMTHAGVGINGAFDFPIKVVPQSGVFHLEGGYIFGDAKDASYIKKEKPNFTDEQMANDSILAYNISLWNYVQGLGSPMINRDYLIRANGQFHYTFGVSIDENYWFRFGVGATVYNVETWRYFAEQVSDPNNPETLYRVVYKKDKSETVGGVSGKIEFMAKNIKTPFGASVSYFDESLGVDGWFQIPIIANTLALKLEAKGFFSAFKDNPHPWESTNVFIGSARFVINF